MQLFCRLQQKEVQVSKSETLHSGLFNLIKDKTEQGLVFDISHRNSINFYPQGLQKTNHLEEMQKKLEIIYDGIKYILDKYQDTIEFSHLLPSEINNEIKPNDLDNLIEEAFNTGLFFTIAQQPRMSMRYDVDLLPTSRAKRYANNHQAHLVAHSECWQQRTLLGIIPKKLLAKISEDEYGIYENVVYARLLDNLQKYLFGIYIKLKQVTSFFDEYSSFDGKNKDYRYRNSVTIDWGLAFSDFDTRALDSSSNNLLKNIERYQTLVLQLKSMELYRCISPSQNVSTQLKQTNILIHDKYYRRLANIWQHWLAHSRDDRLSPELLNQKKVSDSKIYNEYVYRVIKQCLEQLGFAEKKSIKQYLHQSGLELSFKPLSAGVWDLCLNQKKVLRLITVSEVIFDKLSVEEGTIIVAPEVEHDDQSNIFKLSPLTIEGREKITAELAKKIWIAVLIEYKQTIKEKMPNKVKDEINKCIGYYLKDKNRHEIKEMCNDEIYSKLKIKFEIAEFIRHCPCCHRRASDQFVLHSEKKAFKANCIHLDCKTEWIFDLDPTIYLGVNKNIKDSGRFGFEFR